MSTLVLSQVEIRRLLPMEKCVQLMAEALKTLGRGDAVNPLRNGIRLPNDLGILGMMPGFMAEPQVLGLKVVAVFPGNHGTKYDSHQGVVVLFDTTHGLPVAILDASEITAIRTAAATAVATQLLAREDASDLAIVGSGVQARTHLEAMCVVRNITRVRVYSPHAEHRERFAREQGERHDVEVTATESAKAAVENADIICTTTTATEPVVHGDWIAPGCHINAVGSSVRYARELDTAAVVRSRLFVDRKESTINEAGDFLFPKKEGAVDDDHIVGEIGDILLGKIGGRRTPDEITLFESLGLAVEDLAASYYVYHRALKEGSGTPVDLGGLAHAAT
ncbi:MAG: ornithine cyclodeaminase family protein [Gemmatimonadetes bacterium]|nr:ornithine cyclodeaminase family protein [Gemmatimonadota bacterium]